MALTREDLRNELGSTINQVNDSDGSWVSGFVSTTEADRWLQYAYEDTYKWYAITNMDRMTRKAYADTVEDQATYAFGGDAADLLAIAWLGIMYDSTDENYTKVTLGDFNDVYQTGAEQASQANPYAFEVNLYDSDNSTYKLGVEFIENCIPDEAITNGLMVRYVERPPLMDDDTDIPEKLPLELQKLIVYPAAAKAFYKMGEDDAAGTQLALYDKMLLAFNTQEQSITAKGPTRIRRSRSSVNKFFNRLR